MAAGAASAPSAPSDASAVPFAVVTYNVLSPALATPDYFTHCKPGDLVPETRLARVLGKLEIEISERRAIICLQEVSRSWSGKLHAFFQQRRYTYIDSLYGGSSSGYMGVGLAFPNEAWVAKDVDIRRVSETKYEWHIPRREWRSADSIRAGDWECPACGTNVFGSKAACYKCKTPKPTEPPTSEAGAHAASGAAGILPALWAWLSGTPAASATAAVGAAPAAPAPAPAPAPATTSPTDGAPAEGEENECEASFGGADTFAWYEASWRKENSMVAVHLQSVSQPQVEVWCGTYHMPCAFTQPKLMAMHASLAMQHLQRLAASTTAAGGSGSASGGSSTPCLLGGDWNIKPTSAVYTLLTSGRLPSSTPPSLYPSPPPTDSWRPELACPMTSAYAAVVGAEPDCTNHAQTCRDDAPFIDVLDYIFISPHIRALGATRLPSREVVGGPLPNGLEPSDHLMISVQLEIPTRCDPKLVDVYTSAEAAEASGRARQMRGGERGGERGGVGWKEARKEADEQLRRAKRAELVAFVEGGERILDFPPSLNSFERMLVHALAEELQLEHCSHGEGHKRFIRVQKKQTAPETAAVELSRTV